MKLLLTSAALLNLAAQIRGHGYLLDPISRNYYSYLFGLDFGTEPDKPSKDYCFHCLNTKGPGSVCGTSEQGVNYDEWLDSLGQPVSWNSNGNIYGEGDVITVNSFLASHHTGHMELRACPMGRASTQDCFDQHVLEFVEDINSYDVKMPKDNNHPERGYYYGSQAFNNQAFSMRFRLPQGLVGEEVLLQWLYVTANSCSPEGYAEYYSLNSDLPQDFWNPQLPTCTPEQFPPAFFTGDSPERFVNCAEITVVSEVNEILLDEDVVAPAPTPVPISTQPPVPIVTIPNIAINTPAPIPTPTFAPVGGNENGCCSQDFKTCIGWCGSTREECESPGCSGVRWLEGGALASSNTCVARWGACTNDTSSCCNGLECKGSSIYYKQCVAPSDPAPS